MQHCLLIANNTIVYDKKCVDGCQKYVYKTHEVKSIISEFDLACGGNKVLATLSNSAFWFSCMIACFVIGYAGDRFGRKPPNLLCIVIFFLSSTAATFSPNIWFYISMRFFGGFGYGGFTSLSYLIMAETVERKYLAHLSMGTQVSKNRLYISTLTMEDRKYILPIARTTISKNQNHYVPRHQSLLRSKSKGFHFV